MSEITAPSLFALAQSTLNDGADRCHWCGSPCPRQWPHDDRSTDPFTPRRSTAKLPGNTYICRGCWLWRRKRVTVTFLSGKQLDRREACDHSWWIVEEGAWGVSKEDNEEVYLRLLCPPVRFTLCLLNQYGGQNLLHLAHVNDNYQVKADTPLYYTLNNTKMEYTVYELEEALKHGTDGKHPGVRALIDFFGHFQISSGANQETIEVKRNRGRPPKRETPDDKPIRRLITDRSGAQLDEKASAAG